MNPDPAQNRRVGVQIRAITCANCLRNRCTGCVQCQSHAALLADELTLALNYQIAQIQEHLLLIQERKKQYCLCHWDIHATDNEDIATHYICRRCQRIVSDGERELIDENARRDWALFARAASPDAGAQAADAARESRRPSADSDYIED